MAEKTFMKEFHTGGGIFGGLRPENMFLAGGLFGFGIIPKIQERIKNILKR